jgi:8-oxo-dGTP pyrophosphatase MutT (NUDIX family)
MANPPHLDRGPPPPFAFTYDKSVSHWNITVRAWLSSTDSTLDGLCTGIVVFNPEGRVLLIQRAPHDSMPHKWETPGGGVDDDDPSLLHAAARELWEESGLVAVHFTRIVPEGSGQLMSDVFSNRTGKRFFRRVTLLAEVDSCEHVVLDPAEHQDFVWATEDEVRQQRIGDRELIITHTSVQELLLGAFRLREEILPTL